MGYKYKYRGLAVIIVNLFKDTKQARGSAELDFPRMRDLFLALDFKVEFHIDKTQEDIKSIMEKAKKWEFQDYDPECFVCVISSHGSEEHIKKRKTWEPAFYTADDNGKIFVSDLAANFSQDCDAYKGKPKLFFIQACRNRDFEAEHMFDEGKQILVKQEGQGEKTDGGNENGIKHSGDSCDSLSSLTKNEGGGKYELDPDLEEFYNEEDKKKYGWYSEKTVEPNVNATEKRGEVDQSDAKRPTAKDQSDAKGGTGVRNAPAMPDFPDREEITLIECPKDFLMMFPVAAGRSALRGAEEGSWMFYYMYKLRDSLIQTGSFLPFLTLVADKIARHNYEPEELGDNTTKCAALVMHRLTTDLVFEPMSENSVMAAKRKKLAS